MGQYGTGWRSSTAFSGNNSVHGPYYGDRSTVVTYRITARTDLYSYARIEMAVMQYGEVRYGVWYGWISMVLPERRPLAYTGVRNQTMRRKAQMSEVTPCLDYRQASWRRTGLHFRRLSCHSRFRRRRCFPVQLCAQSTVHPAPRHVCIGDR